MPRGIYPREKRATGERSPRWKHGEYVGERRSEASRERRRAHARQKYSECGVPRLERQKLYRERNKEKIRAASLAYRQSAAGILASERAKARRRTPEGRAKRAAEWQRWRQKHPLGKRERWLKQKYGLTMAEYDSMLALQGGGCKICRRQPSGRGVGKILEVDHCHKTGRVRGLICRRCNTAVAYLELEPELLQRMVEYLAIEHVKVEVV